MVTTMVGMAFCAVHYFVNLPPVGKPAQIAVVDINVRNELGGGGFVREGETSERSVAVDRVKVEATLLAEANRILQEFAFAGGP